MRDHTDTAMPCLPSWLSENRTHIRASLCLQSFEVGPFTWLPAKQTGHTVSMQCDAMLTHDMQTWQHTGCRAGV